MMHRNITLPLLAIFASNLAFALPNDCNIEKIAGHYEKDKGRGYLPSTLLIKLSKKSDVFKFGLDSYHSFKPNDDGSSTSQAIFAGDLHVKQCFALYVSAEENDNCQLVMLFRKNKVEVVHFGDCPFIGHNAQPDGIYERTRLGER